MTEDDVERVLLTAENIKDADEFMDGEGSTCRRMPNGHWSWVDDHDAAATDARIMERPWRYMRGAYVTKWKPGREPKPANKWVKGYVTQAGEGSFGDGPAPIGTVLHDGKVALHVSADNHYFPAGWVVVREAPPAEEPWRRVVVDVRGEGEDARVRFQAGHFGLKGLLSAGIFAAHAAPAPGRAKVATLLDDWRHDRGAMLCDILDYVCGPAPKDGDA